MLLPVYDIVNFHLFEPLVCIISYLSLYDQYTAVDDANSKTCEM